MLEKQRQVDNSTLVGNEFQALAFEHVDSLYNTALRMTKNALDAEDLLQDVYLRAFRFFHRFEKGTNFKAWIFKILTNTYINQYRKKINKPYHVDLEKIKYNYDIKEATAQTSAQESERLDYETLFDDEIKNALQQIPDEFRVVVLLADVESFSYKEVAKIIGCPIGTVMSRLSRGRKQLQNYLREYARKGGFINKIEN
ncbi:sigma-70 family RNA polymerase sigma factor [candidate division KSB1 bacterium]|nr:sigma-70 family RNA polymerase sigma factor [candidate division KSB1 bacterium]MCH8957732.1 sigma-70 family RNA polymerase sigma factor [candidate division KSB1 bacterium]